MAISLSSGAQDALNNPQRYGAVLFTFVFGSGTYGLWTRGGERTINGVVYRGGGSVLSLGQIEQNSDGSVSQCTLSLSTQPDKGLTTDILTTFYDEEWHNRPVTIDACLLDPDTMEVVVDVVLFRGIMTSAPFTEGPAKASIDALLQSKSIELSGQGGMYRNAQSQVRIDPTDTSLANIGVLSATITKSLNWGQA